MRSTWAKPALIVATLLPLQACGSPEANAFAVSLASTVASQIAQQLLNEGPAPAPSHSGGNASGGGQGGASSGGGAGSSTGATGGGSGSASTGGGSNPSGSSGGSTAGGGAGAGLPNLGGGLPGLGSDILSGGQASTRPSPLPSLAPGLPDGTPTAEESQLLALLKNYRRSKGLPDVPTSRSMMIVAQAHAADLDAHPNDKAAGCNMHSWSSHGPWKAVCYTSDHAQAKLMWEKPQELGTGYPGNGYEIAFGMTGAKPTPQEALDGWISSPGHHAVMINEDSWKDNPWQAVGAGMKGGYAVIWFGEEADPRP